MDREGIAIKKAAAVGLAALGILLIGSVVFFRERVLFADSASFMYAIISSGRFGVLSHRYGEYVMQFYPFIAQRLHFPVKAIVIGYSASYNLLYVAVAAILIFWYRQYKLAIVMALYYFLFVSASGITFNDTSPGIALMSLCFGIVMYYGQKGTNIFLIIVPFLFLAVLTVTLHFVLIMPVVFLWVYLLLEHRGWPYSTRDTLLLTGLLVLLILVKYIGVSTDNASHDAASLPKITKLSLKDPFVALDTSVVCTFMYRCVANYWIGTLVFIAGIGSLIAERKMRQAIWALLFALGYMMAMGLTYSTLVEQTALWHIEGEWACIGIIVATPFAFSFLPRLKSSRAQLAMAAILAIRLVYIGLALPDFSARIDMETKIMDEMKKKNITKLAIYGTAPIYQKLILDWGVTFESLLTSAMNRDEPQRTFFFVNRDDMNTQNFIKSKNNYYQVWGDVDASGINRKYFSVDTTAPYRVMSYEELFK